MASPSPSQARGVSNAFGSTFEEVVRQGLDSLQDCLPDCLVYVTNFDLFLDAGAAAAAGREGLELKLGENKQASVGRGFYLTGTRASSSADNPIEERIYSGLVGGSGEAQQVSCPLELADGTRVGTLCVLSCEEEIEGSLMEAIDQCARTLSLSFEPDAERRL